ALALNYTTRCGDTHDRVLVVMVGGAAPITLPLDNLPRWNDATGQAMPDLKLHNDPKLASAIGFGTRMTTSAYLADGTLTETDDGKQTATPNRGLDRSPDNLPYPANALLAIEITADLEDGGTQTTTAWLPFEPDGSDALVPKRFFNVDGLGSVGLAFRPASKKLPFALGATIDPPSGSKLFNATVHLADADADGRLLQPASYRLAGTSSFGHVAKDLRGRSRQYAFHWLRGDLQWQASETGWRVKPDTSTTALIQVETESARPFILAGLITFVLGVVVDRLLVLAGRLKAYGDKPPAESPSKVPSSISNPSP
ncbi:MAG: hypothetical protein ACPGYV_06535, partial [Phycisphaeraceae bacterium]